MYAERFFEREDHSGGFMQEEGPRRRFRGRRRGRKRHQRREGPAVDPDLMTPEEEAYYAAHEEVERKVELTSRMVRYGIINLLLLMFVWPIGVIFLIVNAVRFGRPLYEQLVEPRVREKFLRDEVDKRVNAQLVRERQDMEGEHARSMQELSASIAHEIRNPITAAKSLVQQMEEDPSAQDNIEYARVALEELSRVERSVSHLLRFARDEELRRRPMNFGEVVDSAVETFRDRAGRSGVEIVCDLEQAAELEGDAEKLRRVVINLLGNALDALEESGKPDGRIDISLGENLAGTEIWLRIADNGPGIDGVTREHLFSPFHTSKDTGTGLGLPISRKLVDAHGGSIEVRSEPGEGTEFVVTLPRRSVEGRV
jgi:signal transduction histidine kinase